MPSLKKIDKKLAKDARYLTGVAKKERKKGFKVVKSLKVGRWKE